MGKINTKKVIGELQESVKLDLVDKKILYELDLNGRITFSDIGKKIKLSKQAIKERIKRLEKKGVIKQYFALIDIHRLGHTFYRLDLRFQNLSELKEQEIIKYILKLPKVIWVAEIHGKWDLAIVFLTKDVLEIDNNIKNIVWKFNTYIQEQSFSVATTHSRYKYGFLLNKEKEDREIFMGRELTDIKLSSTENKVLSILARNGRMPIVDIARKIGKSISSVKHSMKNLKNKKVLLGFSTLIDLHSIGYLHYKLFINFQNPSKEKERKLESYFKMHPNIIFMTKSLGRSDIECEVAARSISEFKGILREIKYNFSDVVKDIETYLVLNQHVTNYYPV
jgi:Lrp/AsnC family transcriptional regulator, leucine-responsive regulatory protein